MTGYNIRNYTAIFAENLVIRAVEILLRAFAGRYSAYKYFFILLLKL